MHEPDDLRQHLAAILAADAAGYSRLMAGDERATLVALERARGQFRGAVGAQGGRIVDTAGDSVLAVFDSASAAVSAALHVQAALGAESVANAGAGDGARLRFRIGIHLGEVITCADGQVYGDGVNIAARLQTLAKPGGIVVSAPVRGAVGGRLGIGFVDLGERALKNIALPVRAYEVQPATATGPAWPAIFREPRDDWRSQSRRSLVGLLCGLLVAAIGAWALIAKPWAWGEPQAGHAEISVAVLPFGAPGADSAEVAWAGELTRAITHALSRWTLATVAAPAKVAAVQRDVPDARAIGRALQVRYLVEGEVAPRGTALVVALRVVDAETGRLVSGREFESPRSASDDERTLLQWRVTRRTRMALSAALAEERRRAADAQLPAALVQRGHDAWANDENAGWRAARDLFDRALQIDPRYVPAIVARGWTLDREYTVVPDTPDPRVLADLELASAQAIAIDPGHEEAWLLRSVALLHLGRYGEARAAVDIAIGLAPYEPSHIAVRASLMQVSGQQREAEVLLLRAIALDPPGAPFLHRTLCGSRLLMGRYDEAATSCEQAAARVQWFEDQMLLTAIHAQRGDMAQAAIARAEMLRQQPGATLANNLYLRVGRDPEFLRQVEEHLIAGLRKAGIPER